MSPGELIEPGYNGEVSLKSAYKKPLANSLADVERNVVSGESAQITPNEDARLAPNNRSIEVADRQLADNFTGATTDDSVANNSRNVNEDVKYKLNPEHEAQVRAYNEHITRLRQREEYLRGQGMSENAPAMINLRKAQEQAIYARDHIGEVDENGLKYKLDNSMFYRGQESPNKGIQYNNTRFANQNVDAEFNTGAVERLAQGLKYGTDKDISFLRMRPELLDQANVIRKTRGLNPYKDNTVTAYTNAVNNHLNKRVNEGMSPERVAYMAADSLMSPESQAYGGTTSRGGYNRDHINIVASPGETGRYNTATIADFNGNISLKNISPRREGEIKNLSQQREEISRASDGGANVVPSSTNSDSYVGGAPVSAGRSPDGANIAQEAQNVNEVDKLGNVLAYDISGIRKSTGRGLDGSAISADALDQSIDNSSIPNNPQDVNDENSHITCSMESAEANQYTTKKNELKSSWNRAESQFNDQTRQNQQQRRTNINNINDRSAVGLRGLLRSLGSMGAVGSDMQLAGRAVQNQANQQRTGAGQTYAQNQKQIDTTWGQFKNDYADEDKKLNDWKANEDNAARQSSQTTRQNLLTQLAQMKSQKAAAQGANGANAARADLGRANALSSEIDNLGRQQSTYSGNKVQYNAKDLDSYKVEGDTAVGVSDPQAAGNDPTLNIYNTRLRQEDERKRQNQYL